MQRLLTLLLLTLVAAAAPYGHNPALNPVDFAAAPEGGAVTIVGQGQAAATVVIAPEALADQQSPLLLAAREFIDYVKLATGVELPLAAAAPADGNVVLIGPGPLADKLGLSAADLPLEGFRVRTFAADGRRGLAILGRLPAEGEADAPDGTLFGVQDVLERFLGVRWYYPGEDGQVVPETAALTIQPVHYTDAPNWRKRTVYIVERGMDWRRFNRRLRCGNSSAAPFTACHSPGSWQVHAEDHPATFELKANGERDRHMPCYGNPETARVYLEDIARFYATGDTAVWTHPSANVDSAWFPPRPGIVPISPPDKGVECHCQFCAPLYDRQADRHGRASKVVANHVRLVAEGLRERWPDKLVWYLPYSNYTTPPPDLRLPGNVIVGVCMMRGAANYKHPDCAADHDGWIAGWHRITGRPVHLWEYLCWPADDTALPFQYPHVCRDFIRKHRDSVDGSFINGGYSPKGLAGGNFASFHPTLYCWMRLMWDPDFDVDAALAEYVQLMYGPARAPMGRVIDRLTARWEQTRWEQPPGGHHVSPRQIHEETMPPDQVRALAADLAEARRLAGDEGLWRRRVDFLGNAVDLFVAESAAYHDQTGVKVLPVLKVGANPKIDGKLDDAAWRDAPAQTFVRARDAEQPEPEAPSTVQAVWTDRGVTFAFRFTEPLPEKMKRAATVHDQAVYNDDCIEVFLDWRGDRSEYVQLIVNPLGTLFDRHSRLDADWNAEGLERAVAIGEDAWTVELYVPYAGLPDGAAPQIGDSWYGNFIRSRRSTGQWQLTRWSTRYRSSNLDFSAFGRLRFVE